MSLPPGVTIEMLMDAARKDNGRGFCLTCGIEHDDYCEPDACNYRCSDCGAKQVFGAEELILMNVP